MKIRITLTILICSICCAAQVHADTPPTTIRTNFEPTEKGVLLFRSRVNADPRDYASRTLLAQLLVRQAIENGETPLYLEAKQFCEQALAIKPGYRAAKAQLARVLNALHQFNASAAIAEELLKESPSSVEALALSFDADIELGKFAAAEATLQRLARLYPADPAVVARQARIAELRGDYTRARQLLHQAELEVLKEGDYQQELVWYRLRLGELAFKQGDFTHAEAQYRSALDAWPESYRAKEHLAEVLAAKGRHAEAITLYEELLGVRELPELHQALGELLLYLHQDEKARLHFEKAKAAFQTSVERGEVHYLHHLAGYYSDIELKPDYAVQLAEADILNRKSVEAYDQLAWALYRQGSFPAARVASEKALALGTRDAHLLYHASMIYSAAGDPKRGAKLLKQAMQNNPNYNSFHVDR